MIYCIIDGDRVYPSLSSNIKITRENPNLKNKGSYTLEVTFPLDIYENLMKFGHLNRMDVSLTRNDYTAVALYVDNMAVISGTGVLTSVTNDEVRLQIMDSNSELNYVVGNDGMYLDMLDIPSQDLPLLGYMAPEIQRRNPVFDYDEARQSKPHVGDETKGVYVPVYDETNERVVNEMAAEGPGFGKRLLLKAQCQHNLLYVMRMALAHYGYTADLSAIDTFPWNRIYIVNTGRGLPHWTVERFLREFKAFFGLGFCIVGKNAVFSYSDYNAEPVAYECLDEFTAEYDEEGVNNKTSNLAYNLYDSEYKTYPPEIPEEVMRAFTVKEYDSDDEMRDAFDGMDVSEKVITIFSSPSGYFYARTNDEDFDYTKSEPYLERAGFFNKLVRDPDSDDVQELNIVPVTMGRIDYGFRILMEDRDTGHIIIRGFTQLQRESLTGYIPVAENTEAAADTYTTVQQALEDGETAENNVKAESERMEVFFLDTGSDSFTAFGKELTKPTVGTDYRISPMQHTISLALDKYPYAVHLGQLHKGTGRMDGKNQRCIRFITDDMPDPTSIYLFRGKRYVCEKIEVQVTDGGIDKVKTGYFYEVLESTSYSDGSTVAPRPPAHG